VRWSERQGALTVRPPVMPRYRGSEGTSARHVRSLAAGPFSSTVDNRIAHGNDHRGYLRPIACSTMCSSAPMGG
jgi:hypothetical protein